MYIEPGSIYVASNGIFLNIDGEFYGVTSLEVDEKGVYIPTPIAVIVESMAIIQAVLQFVLIAWLKKNVKNKKTWVLLCLSLGAFFLTGFSSPETCLLRESARVELNPFFRLLFQRSEFGYTLFGQKPMSFYSYFIKLPSECVMFGSFTDPKIEKHYLTYGKYKDELSFVNYIILDQLCISNKFPTSGIVRDVFIINKRAFTAAVNEHLSLFKEKLGKGVCADGLLRDIESGKNILFDVLKEDELLWGILLGYGDHNAEIYARREAIKDGKTIALAPGYSSLEEELNAIDGLLEGFTHEYFIDLIPLPMFMCDANHIETQMLKNKYQQVQEHIRTVYNSPDFLDLVLHQLKS